MIFRIARPNFGGKPVLHAMKDSCDRWKEVENVEEARKGTEERERESRVQWWKASKKAGDT